MNTRYFSTSTLMVLAFLALYFIWGSTYLAIRIAIETMPPLIMLGFRFVVAGAVMLLWMRWRGKEMPSLQQWKSAAVTGGLMLCLGTGSVAWAIQTLPSGLAALLITTVPLWMVLLDWLWKSGPRPSFLFFAGFALGMLGIGILFDPHAIAGGYPVDGWAASAVLLGALGWSIGSIHGRGAQLPSDPFMSTALQMSAGGILLVFSGLLTGERLVFVGEVFTLRSVTAWGYLLVFGSFVAFSAYVWLMRNSSPARVSTYAFVNPVVALFLGWAFAGEPITSRILLASMLLVSAVVIVIRYSPKYGDRPATAGTNSREPAVECS
jgi:drug/metabolite transporter (DMT)-like permease